MDSQRKISAPTAQRPSNPRSLASKSGIASKLDMVHQQEEEFRGSRYIQEMTNEATSEGAPNKELLTITVEIGNGQQASILIREMDDPWMLADQFARQHGVGDALRDLLAEQIKMNIEQVLDERDTKGHTGKSFTN